MTRTAEIKQICKQLETLWLKYPSQRFGQLLFNYTRFGTCAGDYKVIDPFHFQDSDILHELKCATKGLK